MRDDNLQGVPLWAILLMGTLVLLIAVVGEYVRASIWWAAR